jgi:acyl-CoA dehydrogenase
MSRFIDRELERELDIAFSRLLDAKTTAASQAGSTQSAWEAVTAMDLPGIAIDEAAGGSGGELPQLAALMRSAGRYAVPLPIAEHHLAGWLLGTAGAHLPKGISTVIPPMSAETLALTNGCLTGVAHQVPWAPIADQIVALVKGPQGSTELVCLRPHEVQLSAGTDLAGQPQATLVSVDTAPRPIRSGHTAAQLKRRAALLRTLQIAGALERIAADTLEYVQTRRQFGVPIGSFQSVQQHVVVLHQMAAMTNVCAERMVSASITATGQFETDAAYVVASQNAATGVRAAHQAHGAIGMTEEYPLHHFTRRLQLWRWDLQNPRDRAIDLAHTVSQTGRVRDCVTARCGAMEAN